MARKGGRGGRGERLRFAQPKGFRSGGVSPFGCAGAAVTDVDQRVSDEDQLAYRAIPSVLERLALARNEPLVSRLVPRRSRPPEAIAGRAFSLRIGDDVPVFQRHSRDEHTFTDSFRDLGVGIGVRGYPRCPHVGSADVGLGAPGVTGEVGVASARGGCQSQGDGCDNKTIEIHGPSLRLAGLSASLPRGTDSRKMRGLPGLRQNLSPGRGRGSSRRVRPPPRRR